MAETIQGTYQVDFQSLIKVLGVNLYADPKASIRELIQNANDSIVRRTDDLGYKPSIRVTTDDDGRQLIVEDNGAGMVEEEVVTYLASIGGGRTRTERKRLETTNKEAADMLIGQFGVGFLSTFVIADRVTVDTCSANGGDPVYWECAGTEEYQIGVGDRGEPGTTVTLDLKPAHFDLLEEGILRETIIKYADFISFPVYLNDDLMPLNRMNAPWHEDAREMEYAAYVERRYGVAPLAVCPLDVHRDEVKVQGVVCILPDRAATNNRMKTVELFQKRMYVHEDIELLPDWACFVCAILDCSTVDLVVSREAANKNEAYLELKRCLDERVSDFISDLFVNDHILFLRIVKELGWLIIRGAVLSDTFFHKVKNLLLLPSNLGPMTIPKYLQYVPAQGIV